MKKTLLIAAAVLLFCTGALPPVQAVSYRYNDRDEAVAAPDGYVCTAAVRGDETAPGESWDLTDLFADEDGLLLALDANGGRIHVFDASLRYQKTVGLTLDGEAYTFTGAGGLFASGRGEQKRFYITDPSGGQVLLADAEGRILRRIGRPDTDLIDENAVYDPTKVQLGKNGNLYVLAPGLYMGACVLSTKEDYRFKTFLGSGQVERTFSVVMDHFWKRLLNEEQIDRMSVYVPVAFSNFTLDAEGYLYTVTNKNTDADSKNEIKKFNMAGSDILPDRKYGDLELGYIDQKLVNTAFSDISVSDGGNIVAIDGSLCRVHVFDPSGERLFVFGERGDTAQAFDTPVAVETVGDAIVVLDRDKATVLLFEPTPFGKAVLEGSRLSGEGEYAAAAPYWTDVLQDDAGCLLAQVGLGKAALENGDYREAMRRFRLGASPEDWSQAFGLYRAQRMRAFFPPIFALLMLGFLGLLIAERRVKFRRGRGVDPAQKSLFGKVRYALFHPCEGGYVLARRTPARTAVIFSVGVAALWFVASVVDWQYAGFLFGENDAAQFEVLIHLLKTFGLFALWTVSCWFVADLMDSSARIGDIMAVTAVALLPYVLSIALHTGLSHLLTLEEAPFLYALQAALWLWSAVILIGGMKEIHEMTVRRTLLMLILLVFGMALIVFLLLLAVSLLQNVFDFLLQVWQEAVKAV